MVHITVRLYTVDTLGPAISVLNGEVSTLQRGSKCTSTMEKKVQLVPQKPVLHMKIS